MEQITVRQALRRQDELIEQIVSEANGLSWTLRDLPDFPEKEYLVKQVAQGALDIIKLCIQIKDGEK